MSRERERIALSDKPTRVCSVRRSGVFLTNTGTVDVVVDTREYIDREGRNAGLTIRAGQTVTIPASLDGPLTLYAITAGGSGELTYLFL